MTAIPECMRAVVLEQYRENVTDAICGLKIVQRPLPKPLRGQVLVRVAAAPCNPSDLLLLQGKYGTLKSLPTVPGWEGAGTVAANGGGLLARWLMGKRVACALQKDRDGTWAEYFVADAKDCIPLRSQIPFDQGAGLIVNPMTAIGLLSSAQKSGHRAAVSTAAASQLGRMLASVAVDDGFPLIHVVRREAQVKLLRSLGATHILNSSNDEFRQELKDLCNQLGATAAFEAIAGEMTGTILNAMPRDSTLYLYGALSEQACGDLDPVELIFRSKTVTGFYLGAWLRRQNVLGKLKIARRIQQMIIDGRIETKVRRRLGIDEVIDGLMEYVGCMTEGKMLICPSSLP
jgi:NADPH:quinone reductase-like Zn-dependent oxidoreductase